MQATTPYFRALDNLGNEVISPDRMRQEAAKNNNLQHIFNSTVTLLQSAGFAKMQVLLLPHFAAQPTLKAREDGIFECPKDEGTNPAFSAIEFVCAPSAQQCTPDEAARKRAYEQVIFAISILSRVFKATAKQPSPTSKIPYSTSQALFGSGVYGEYIHQMQTELYYSQQERYKPLLDAKVDTLDPYERRCRELIETITSVDRQLLSTHRMKHEQIVAQLRACMEAAPKGGSQTPSQGRANGFVEALCTWIYTNEGLYHALRALLELELPYLRDCTNISLLDAVERAKEPLKLCCSGFEFVPIPRSDGLSVGNLPFHLFTFKAGSQGGGKEIRVIRSPTVCYLENGDRTIESCYKVTKEFLLFVEQLTVQQKRLLFLNFMIPWNLPEYNIFEGFRTKALHTALAPYRESGSDCKTLDRTSTFFTSMADYSDERDSRLKQSAHFKERLLAHLFVENGIPTCLWGCPEWKLDEKEKHLRAILEAVHTHYFQRCELIDQRMRTLFQELLYLEYIDNQLLEKQYDYFIVACQAACDRAPSFLALFLLKQAMKEGKENDPETIRQIVSILNVSAFVIERRPIHVERVNDFLGAAQILLSRGLMPRIT